ncbi:efflux RND transporter periplasmic adaptor subunit [Candidatus Pelagibacter sp.]|nr:efflux RND transporter periplasmic adaptor subunit [Candidatus Pelagibacter sp.]MDB4828354.1 efflux RND transporter periplasmic adaptor subunit [Candidatus Pelagibacter sp.]
MNEDKNIKIARLIGLEKKSREARTQDELNFVVVNETRQIFDFVNSYLLLKTPTDKYHVKAVSDLATVDRTAPLVTFVENIINDQTSSNLKEIQNFEVDKISRSLKIKKPKNIPDNILLIPIFSPQRGLQGFLITTRNEKFNDNEVELARHLSLTYGHAYNTFLTDFSIKDFLKKNFTGKRSWIIILSIIFILIIPIKITSTAPVEVVPKNPRLITAPFDGVVKNIIVNNNDKINSGDLLIQIEDTDLKNSFNLAKQSLQVAEKELLRSRQFSFSNNEEKARLAELMAQVDLKKAEVESTSERLKNSKIYADKDGIAIVDQKNNWQGRPVSVGEKIITIANPDKVEFLIWLPVKDSLIIKENTDVKVFLDINPIKPLKGKLKRASYQSSLSPEEVLSYQISASFEGEEIPRIGLRGTAKIYGSRVTLFYYLFRKPITFVRQLIGV